MGKKIVGENFMYRKHDNMDGYILANDDWWINNPFAEYRMNMEYRLRQDDDTYI